MNYIKHLSAFYNRIAEDTTLNPTHISLYMALFQFWNSNRFKNPVSITRSEVMHLSRIGSVATYHRCITYLHDMGFINYQPSYNPLAGSKVFITEFLKPAKARSKSSLLTGSLPVSEMERNRSTSSLNIEQLMDPSINIKNSINIKPVNGVVPQPVLSRFKKKDEVKADSSEQKKGFRKKTQSNFRPGENIPPPKSEIQLFFAEKNAPAEEAEKFFNHYEANGWQVGGRSRMKNWQAAARNWLLNSGKFNTENIVKMAQINAQILKPGHLSATVNKSYQDKL